MKQKKPYVNTQRRRKEGKTDYRKRKAAILSRMILAAPRITGKNVSVQFISPEIIGDRVVISSHSRELSKYGWNGSRNSLPAAYLTGLLAGLKGVSKKVDGVVVYLGVARFVNGSRLASIVKGIKDSGVKIAADEDNLPTEDRIRGEHIAAYSKSFSDEKELKERFSNIINSGLSPSDYPKHFDDVHKKILTEFGASA